MSRGCKANSFKISHNSTEEKHCTSLNFVAKLVQYFQSLTSDGLSSSSRCESLGNTPAQQVGPLHSYDQYMESIPSSTPTRGTPRRDWPASAAR